MFAIGLTGGIGSGKSAVADQLVERGAVLIDADLVAREVVEPGGPAYQPLIDRFGTDILDGHSKVDRPALAAKVFSNPEALRDLNAITHPAIGIEMIQRRQALADSDAVVVLAIPLLTAQHRETVGLNAVVVVDCPTEVAIERLVTLRSMERADAQARIDAQISRPERNKEADFVLDNSGSLQQLGVEVERLWSWIEEHKASLNP
jgi:dephospho-CoA kinase